MLRLLPWGHLVTESSMHLYVRFVVDFWEVLLPLAPELRRLKRESNKRLLEEEELEEEELRICDRETRKAMRTEVRRWQGHNSSAGD